jgi:hypothetical protein
LSLFKNSLPLLRVVLVAAFCFLAPVVPAKQTRDTPGSPKTKIYQRPTDASLYVGSEACKSCHEDTPSNDFYKNYESSPHFVTTLDTKKGPQWQGCEACHGPGKEHVDGGGDKSKIFTFKGVSAQEVGARCLDCHQYGEEHANFGRSAHLQSRTVRAAQFILGSACRWLRI